MPRKPKSKQYRPGKRKRNLKSDTASSQLPLQGNEDPVGVPVEVQTHVSEVAVNDAQVEVQLQDSDALAESRTTYFEGQTDYAQIEVQGTDCEIAIDEAQEEIQIKDNEGEVDDAQ